MSKILIISPYFWPEEIGSAPYCSDTAISLSEKGHDVTTVAFRPHYPSIEPFAAWSDGRRDHETHAGVKIERVAVRARGAGGFGNRARNDLRFLAHMVSSALKGRYRGTTHVLAYVPSVLTLYGAKLVSLLTGAQTLAVVHDIESGLASSLGIVKEGALLRVIRFVERVGLNSADKIIVLTEGMKQELIEIGCRRPIEVVSIWGSIAPDVQIDPDARPVLMYSGNFGKKQNIDQLIPLLERLSNSKVDIVLRGDGSERQRIEDEVKRRGVKNVQFLPLVSSEKFMAALQGAHIHLVPQAMNVANYALPSKLFSIMSAGRPFVCIAPLGSPLHDLAQQSKAGLCVAQGDDEALFRAVTDLLDDRALMTEMGHNGQCFVARNMDRSAILEHTANLLGVS